jgi:hypothetical protein
MDVENLNSEIDQKEKYDFYFEEPKIETVLNSENLTMDTHRPLAPMPEDKKEALLKFKFLQQQVNQIEVMFNAYKKEFLNQL